MLLNTKSVATAILAAEPSISAFLHLFGIGRRWALHISSVGIEKNNAKKYIPIGTNERHERKYIASYSRDRTFTPRKDRPVCFFECDRLSPRRDVDIMLKIQKTCFTLSMFSPWLIDYITKPIASSRPSLQRPLHLVVIAFCY